MPRQMTFIPNEKKWHGTEVNQNGVTHFTDTVSAYPPEMTTTTRRRMTFIAEPKLPRDSVSSDGKYAVNKSYGKNESRRCITCNIIGSLSFFNDDGVCQYCQGMYK
jgi:hypothetical protein